MTRVSAALTTLTRSRAHEAGGEASGTADADSTFAALLEGATTLDGATSGQGKHPVGSGEGNESDGDERDDGGGGGTSGVRHHRTSHETGHSAASSGAMLEASAGAIGAASLIVTAPAAALAASTGTRQLASARVASEVGGAAGRTVPASQLRSPAGEDVGGTAATTLQTPRGATPGDRTQAARTDDLDGGAVAAPGVPARGDARGVEAPTVAASTQGSSRSTAPRAARPSDALSLDPSSASAGSLPGIASMRSGQRGEVPTGAVAESPPTASAAAGDGGWASGGPTSSGGLRATTAMSDVSATARAGHGSTEARAAGAFTPPDWLDVLSSGTGSIPATRPASHGAGPLAGPAGSAIDEHPGSEPVAATEVAAGLPTTATAAGGGATTTAAGDGATSQRSEVLLGAASEGGRGARGGSGEVATATVSAAAAAEGTPSRRAGLDDEPSTSDGRGTHGVVAAPSQPASISQPLSLLVPGTVSPPTAAASAGATAQADHTPDAPSRLDHIALASAISAPITASDGSHSLSALLTPPELGSVQASVRVDGTSVGVVLTASTDAGHRALSTNLAQLATALSHDGREVQVTLVERGDRGAGSGDGSGAGSGARDRSAAGGSDENGRRQNGNGNSTAQTASSGAGPGGGGRGGESNPTPSQHVAAQDGVADHAGPQSSLGGVAVDSSTRAVGDSLAADGSSHLDLVL